MKNEGDINTVSRSIYRDLLYLLSQWQLLGLENLMNQNNANRVILLKDIFSRIKKNFFEKPEIFENYFRSVKIKTPNDAIFLLLGELETDFLKDDLDYNYFVNYAIYKLLSVWEKDAAILQDIEDVLVRFETTSDDKRIKALSFAWKNSDQNPNQE